MPQPNSVIIDNTRYVPAKDSVPNSEAMLEGLIAQYHDTASEEQLARYAEDLFVIVTDDPRGHCDPPSPMDVLVEISKRA